MKLPIFQYFNLRIIIILSIIYSFTNANSNDECETCSKRRGKSNDNKNSHSYVNRTVSIPFPHAFEETYSEDYLDFIVLGDWGFRKDRNQDIVASAMKDMAENSRTQFIINVGGKH